jgi:RNA polymerase sigma factor (sigma-70 family)
MTIDHLRKALRHLHQVLDPSGDASLTDGQLLARFVATRDEAAFAALMQRHGPMVFGVCHRILRHTQDAEDAFQATFLVLARKAASVVEQRALGSWLYRVAYRIALDAKASDDKRRAHEMQVDDLPHPSVPPAETRDWRKWLDHELNLLPERYRTVLVVCYLEERSRKEAARLLDLAEGTVSSRLARGRRLLAKRLSRYGLSLSAATLAAAWSPEASAAVPLALTSATLLAASGRGVVSASVGFLTKGALKTMFLSKLKWTVGAVMIAAALGATSLAYRSSGPMSFGQVVAAPADKEAGGRSATELELLRREVELLKLKLEVVQEKQKAQEAELRSLRAASGGAAVPPGRTEKGRQRSAEPRPEADERARSRGAAVPREGNQRSLERSPEPRPEANERTQRASQEKRAQRQDQRDVPSAPTEADRQLQKRDAQSQEAMKAAQERARLDEVEAALKTMRATHDPKEKIRRAEALEEALKKLQEQLHKEEKGSQGRR